MSNPKHLLITGAGVDCTTGIDFPMAATLLPDIARFIEGEGAGVDAALRKMLPNLRFSFSSTITTAVNELTSRSVDAQRRMIESVKVAIKDLPEDREHVKKLGELIIRLFDKLVAIAVEGNLDEKTRELIREVFGKDAEDLMDSDSILDIQKLSLSDTFKSVLKRTLRMGLQTDKNEVAQALSGDMLNIERLLVDKFLGFYNDEPSDIRNYLYISWMLWAYLLRKQQAVVQAHTGKPLPFYGALPQNCRAITLNYTSFLSEQLGRENVIYFHGGLAEYVAMSTRELLKIEEDMQTLEPAAFLAGMKGNFKIEGDDPSNYKHVIPALVPPLRLKPILSHRYIEEWHKASEWVKASEHIVVIGYSFNSADEHFNDILRQTLKGKQLTIVGPGVLGEFTLGRMEKVFHVPKGNWTDKKVQGRNAKQGNHITLIQGKADQVDVGKLFGDAV